MMLRFLHIFLAINVLFSSTGLMVFEHLCEVKGRTIGFYIKPEKCCKKETKQSSACCKKQINFKGIAFSKTPCCKDKSEQIKSNFSSTFQSDNITKVFDFKPFINLDFVQNLPYTATEVIPFSQKILRFYLYKPPPQVRDIPVFVQNFRC